MEKHLAAKDLYNEGWDQKDIAAIIRVSEQTIVNWKKKYQWEKKRVESMLARETSEEALWSLINYQLDVLKHKAEKYKEKPKDEWELIDKGDVDALSKMFSSVKGKQLEWTNYVRICRELLDHMQGINLTLAKELIPEVTEFLNNKRKTL